MSSPAILRYPGAKWSIAERLIAHMPPHRHYVEPFFGSGAVFFNKPPVSHEVLGDIDGRVTEFFTVLRDDTEALCWAIEATPWARAERDLADATGDTAVERARRFAVRCWQAHGADQSKATGWRSRGPRQAAAGMSHRWQKLPDQLRAVALRLRDAEIENRPAIEVIARHAGSDVLVYADPPYLPSVRTQQLYRAEMTVADHENLLDVLLRHPGPVMVSGYAHPLYDEALLGWTRIELRAPKVEKAAERLEVLWIRRV